MKKGIIIGLLIVVGGAFIYSSFFNNGRPEIIDIEKSKPAVFAFQENLATIDGQVTSVTVSVTEPVQSLKVVYNDSVIQTWDQVDGDVSFKLNSGVFGVGTRNLSVYSTLQDGEEYVDSRMVRVLSDITPIKMYPRIIKDYPHKRESFTQGLEFYKGNLYEGTGDPDNRGATVVAEVDLETGEHKKSMGLTTGFGEGITLLNDRLYQLTYKRGKCYVYSVNDLQLQKEFNYIGEGWGLCNDGSSLIMSNGSERIVFRDTNTFATTRFIEVYNQNGPITGLNELEYIDGKIYANIWTSSMVVAIDPLTGKVLEEIDASNVVKEGRGLGEVLNGIAFNKQSNKTYMTGKYWERLYEVKFEPFIDPIP